MVGDWTGEGGARRGVFRPSAGRWYLDIDGSGDIDACPLELCSRLFGRAGDLPVVGDWSGSGKNSIGVFRPDTGDWLLDLDGDGAEDGCATDRCLFSFGLPGDFPVVGDWNGNGVAKIGLFRPNTGEWLLDFNGNGSWDGCEVDSCLGPFGEAGDLPVVGQW